MNQLAYLSGDASGLIRLILVIVLIGMIVWAVTTYVPMSAVFKQIILVVAAIVVVLWVARSFGLF